MNPFVLLFGAFVLGVCSFILPTTEGASFFAAAMTLGIIAGAVVFRNHK